MCACARLIRWQSISRKFWILFLREWEKCRAEFCPPGLIGHNPDLEEIEYNPEEAKRLLAEAGYPNGFEMEIAANADDTNTTTQVYEMVQAMLDEVGIDAEIVMYDDATWRAKRAEGQIGSYLSSWSADFNDPDNFIYSIFAPGNSERRSFNYSNEEVKQQIVEARGIVNEEERIALYQELEKADCPGRCCLGSAVLKGA